MASSERTAHFGLQKAPEDEKSNPIKTLCLQFGLGLGGRGARGRGRAQHRGKSCDEGLRGATFRRNEERMGKFGLGSSPTGSGCSIILWGGNRGVKSMCGGP